MNEMVVVLSNGQEVELRETWNCADGCDDSGAKVEVTDCETNRVICTYKGSLPDTDDEDYDVEKLIKKVETEISWAC